MKNPINLISLIISMFIIINLYPQSDNTIDEIDDAVKSLFGNNFSVQAIDTVNSSLKYSNWDFPFFDQYGTLNNCYIFIAKKDKDENSQTDIGVLGIYKNDQIIWNSGPTILVDDLNNTEIMGILDLNRDGEVDIITGWFKWVSSDFYDIWIYSWDGSNGRLIINLDENNKSTINGYDIVLLDREGDGIEELCGNIGCYSWNGSLYGKWDSDPQPEFIPKNIINAIVECTVSQEINGLKYNYRISNNISSIQQIEQFGIDAESENITGFTKPENWDFYYIMEENFLSSEIELPINSHPIALIKPGEEQYEYTFISSGLPKINNIYIQGYNGERDFEVSNIKLNSFITQTLSPLDPPDSLIPINFLDTLRNYNQHSLQLGWISNQTTADKYDSLFAKAKTLTMGNHIPWVDSTLRTILEEVDEDSSYNLTSEAYALIKYNTEYLIENLPEVIPPVLNLISPSITFPYVKEVPDGPYFEVTVSGQHFTDSSDVYFSGQKKSINFLSDSIITFQIYFSDVDSIGIFPVWISNYGSNSDTLDFSVLNNLPQSIVPILECIVNNGNNTYTAFFGYHNYNDETVFIPFGAQNKFSPGQPSYGGQPQLFLPGLHNNVFTVDFTGNESIIWTLDGGNVTANKRSQACP